MVRCNQIYCMSILWGQIRTKANWHNQIFFSAIMYEYACMNIRLQQWQMLKCNKRIEWRLISINCESLVIWYSEYGPRAAIKTADMHLYTLTKLRDTIYYYIIPFVYTHTQPRGGKLFKTMDLIFLKDRQVTMSQRQVNQSMVNGRGRDS